MKSYHRPQTSSYDFQSSSSTRRDMRIPFLFVRRVSDRVMAFVKYEQVYLTEGHKTMAKGVQKHLSNLQFKKYHH